MGRSSTAATGRAGSAASCTSDAGSRSLPPSTIRTCPPCNSSGRRDRSLCGPGFDAPRPTPPCPRTHPSCSPGACRPAHRRAKFGMLLCSFHFLDDALQVLWHFGNRRARHFHPAVASFANDEVERAEVRSFGRVILAEVAAAALAPLGGRPGERLSNGQQVKPV